MLADVASLMQQHHMLQLESVESMAQMAVLPSQGQGQLTVCQIPSSVGILQH